VVWEETVAVAGRWLTLWGAAHAFAVIPELIDAARLACGGATLEGSVAITDRALGLLGSVRPA
jgi:hypothetical protein